MAILEFGIDKNNIYSRNIFEKPLALTPEEELAVDIIYKALSDSEIDAAEIHAERRSTNYISIVAFFDYDFIRLKIGTRSKWFSVFLSLTDRVELANDVRFSNISNKQQIHWKVSFSEIEQLEKHTDLFKRAFTAAKWSYEKTLSKK